MRRKPAQGPNGTLGVLICATMLFISGCAASTAVRVYHNEGTLVVAISGGP